jgi:peptidoglycan-associated lipoprotein
MARSGEIHWGSHRHGDHHVKSLLSISTLALAIGLSACSSTPTNTTQASAANPSTAGSGPSSTGSSASSGANPSTLRSSALPAHLDPGSALAKERSVYFGFDDVTIGQEYQALIEKHGKYLAASPSLKIKIEGNADERGSAEYNLALGQRRAEATRKALKLMGVRDGQMEAISWGEERPRDKGHDDSSYSQNRRADLVYAAP